MQRFCFFLITATIFFLYVFSYFPRISDYIDHADTVACFIAIYVSGISILLLIFTVMVEIVTILENEDQCTINSLILIISLVVSLNTCEIYGVAPFTNNQRYFIFIFGAVSLVMMTDEIMLRMEE